MLFSLLLNTISDLVLFAHLMDQEDPLASEIPNVTEQLN